MAITVTNKCKRVCPTESSFRLHLARLHSFKAFSGTITVPDVPGTAFEYSVTICKESCDSFAKLKKHLQGHIENDDIKVPCPFQNCSKSYSSVVSFKSHLSRSHRTEVSCVTAPQGPSSSVVSNCDIVDSLNILQPILQDPPVELCYDSDISAECGSQTELSHSAALFYLKLESKHKVPSSTVQAIVTELKELRNLNKENLERKLSTVLTKYKLEPDDISNIVEDISNEKSLYVYQKDLASDYLRKQYYQKHLCYTQPQQIFFRDPDGKKTAKFFHYVPILTTIKNMFQDPNVKEQFEKWPPISQPGILKDFFDGSIYQENKFFKNNPEALPVGLFEDALEITSPIGSAKGKHKFVAVYMILGFCSPEWRSHIDSIQLVGLCKEKDLDRNQFYKPLIKDIKQLEDVGFEIFESKIVKGTVAFICGDNLGMHGLMGMRESFSRVEFFCRFCLIVRPLFGPEFPFAARRDVEDYRVALDRLANEPGLASYQGIKTGCPFHECKFYHVSKGTPPCLAHDLFEGVVCYDLALCLKYFVDKKEWFHVDYLNGRIELFEYSFEDRRDKPVTLKKNFTKIGGSASQVWSFIRLLPLLIRPKIKDFNDKVWDLVLRLREIILLVTAPAVKVDHLGYLECQILDYLDLRAALFPEVPLRPKHHYMQHYPELTKELGPLIRLWTLRFEGKHKRLKEIAQASHNFINITKTLSEKHEYSQSYFRAGASYRPQLVISREMPFNSELYHDDIQSAVNPIADQTLMQCDKVTFRGVNYRTGDAVILSQGSTCHDLSFGVIKLVLTAPDQSFFLILEEKNVDYLPHLQIFVFESTACWKCVRVPDLVDYQPLHVYTYEIASCVTLKHGIILWG